jgi:hypothetical protein
MKSYAEFLKWFIGRTGNLYATEADARYLHFVIKKAAADFGNAKLVDVGTDYAEFSVANERRLVPLGLLVVEVE